MARKENRTVPTHLKFLLTIEEASDYFNIGYDRLRDLVDKPEAIDCVLFVGRKRLIKKEKMEKFLNEKYEI